VKRRENNYDTAVLSFVDRYSAYYEDSIAKFDEIKIYFKNASEGSWTQFFGGTIRNVMPSTSGQGYLYQVLCKGYGAALEATHCNRDYGSESAHPTLDTAKEILQDLVSNFVNKSFAGSNTGYGITNTKIADIASGATIKYVNNPYRSCLEVVNIVCELASAIGGGSSAGAHWIVDNNKNLIVNTIGAHENTEVWPDWWNTDRANSTLEEGVDFLDCTIVDKSEEFANKVVLVTDFRRPAYDSIFTDGHASDWGAETAWGSPPFTVNWTDDATTKIVGNYSLKADMGGNFSGSRYGWYPAGQNAGWDITKWGSERNPPRWNFYHRSHYLNIVEVRMFTTDYQTDYYKLDVGGLVFYDDPIDTWVFHSIPVGPYHASVADSQEPRWVVGGGNPDWSNINGICFYLQQTQDNEWLHLDDMHFSGKIARCAYNSTNIASNSEYQKVLISRNAMDDSCVAADDTGFAARIAYAELLRRQQQPKTIIFTTSTDLKAAMPGQKIHVHACKKADGTFRVDADMRIVELQAEFSGTGGLFFTVTATTDLLNTRPVNLPDQYALWQENMFVNSAEAKNIRSGAEVDLLIPLISKDYPS